MSPPTDAPPLSPAASKRVLRDAVAILGSHTGSKALATLVIMIAARKLGVGRIGLVFFAQAMAEIILLSTDFGLFDVLLRRTARAQTGQRTFVRALRIRLAGLGICTLLFSVLVALLFPGEAPTVIGFFLVRGVLLLHQPGRALLSGGERFVLSAGLNLGSRLVGAAFIIVGLYAGGGVWVWVIGALLAESLQLALVTHYAPSQLTADDHPPSRSVTKEGLYFWFLTVMHSARLQLAILLVTALLNYSATAILGIANRVIQGGLLLIRSLSFAVYPTLARDRRRVINREQTLVAIGLATLTSLAILVAAPILPRFFLGSEQHEMVPVIRILAPAVALNVLSTSLQIWLKAKDQESWLVLAGLLEIAATVAFFVIFTPIYGLNGSAIALLLASGVGLAGVGAATVATLHGTAHKLRSPVDRSGAAPIVAGGEKDDREPHGEQRS